MPASNIKNWSEKGLFESKLKPIIKLFFSKYFYTVFNKNDFFKLFLCIFVWIYLTNTGIITSYIWQFNKPESEFLSILTTETFFIFLSFEDIFCTILSESLSPDRFSSSMCFWFTSLKDSSILQLVGVIKSEVSSRLRGLK